MGEKFYVQKSKSEMYSVFLLQYLKRKGHMENGDEDGRILLKISFKFVGRYDVNWIYLYPERIQLLSQLERITTVLDYYRCEGRTQSTKRWKYATPLLQLHY
jgi:hypothetical protein